MDALGTASQSLVLEPCICKVIEDGEKRGKIDDPHLRRRSHMDTEETQKKKKKNTQS